MSSKKSILTGFMLTAGTAVGAGMFTLPIVSSGMWFGFSILCLFYLWFMSYLSGVYILEVNTRYEPGASWNTLVKDVLGSTWNTINGIAIAFLMYILLYAYFSAFGSIISSTFDFEILKYASWSQGFLGLLFGCALAVVVWLSTKFVGRLSTVLVVGMVISFVISMSGFSFHVQAEKLLDQTNGIGEYLPYIWLALPYFLTSYGFANIVPSLYKYYGKEPITIRNSLWAGSFFAFLVYCFFLFVVFGNISRDALVDINASGGNMGDLVSALTQSRDQGFVNTALSIFSNFAIISSFLGVGLGLFDYIADLFGFEDDVKGRLYAAFITFIPPGILSFFFPQGFVAAIGYAGLVCVFCLFIIPFLLVYKTRKSAVPSAFKVKGGNFLLFVFLISSCIIAVLFVLSKMGYLAKW